MLRFKDTLAMYGTNILCDCVLYVDVDEGQKAFLSPRRREVSSCLHMQ